MNPELSHAKLAVLAELRVNVIFDLTTRADGLSHYDPASIAKERWTPEHRHRPIPDGGAPASVQAFASIVDEIAAVLESGQVVAIHCWGGVGRTGMVAAGLLLRHGWPVDDALAAVNDAWRATPKAGLPKHAHRTAPETPQQRHMVNAYAPQARPMSGDLNLSGISAATTRACLLGGAIGDALGAPVEFKPWRDIQARYGPDGIRDFDVAYGQRGAITDDTQMTLFTAEGALRSQTRGYHKGLCHPPSIIRNAYWRWANTQGVGGVPSDALDTEPGGDILLRDVRLQSDRAPGITCIGALRPGAKCDEENLYAANQSKGCGTVMRVAPLGLMLPLPDAYTWARDASGLTHGHPVGYIAGAVFAAIISAVARGMPLRDAVRASLEHARRSEPAPRDSTAVSEIAAMLQTATALVDQHGRRLNALHLESIGGAWVAEEALAIAVACALAHPDDYQAAVLLAVNHSGDSDSTGSMTGQLVALMTGLEGIPVGWRRDVELADLITLVADDLALGFAPDSTWWNRWPGF
jgi:ADP-ribosylglycohydrolase